MTERYEDLCQRYSHHEFWQHYKQCSEELAGVQTVEQVIEICGRHFGRSSNDAFFPGGSGDTEILSVLLDAGWKIAWERAYYYFAAREPGDGVTPGLTYTEGDIACGIHKPI